MSVSCPKRFVGAKGRGVIGMLFCIGLIGCGSVPDVKPIVEQYPASLPQVIGTRGPLTEKQTKALFARMGPEAQSLDILHRHLAIEQAVAETPLVAGNRTRILRDGDAAFRAMFDAIKGAKNHINLEYYIFEDVQSDGRNLGDLLVEKRRQGVAVNIIFDSYGSDGTSDDFLKRLGAAGIKLVEFNPIDPLEAKNGYSLNDRDHRKILIVDGAKAIVGGINLSTTYQSSSPGKSAPPPGVSPEHWRDTDIEIDGPVVAQLQKLFLDHWRAQKGPALDETGFFPKTGSDGNELVRIIGSTPDNEIPRYYVTLLSAIRNAAKNIWVCAAYFVPTHDEKEDLIAAARRGVDVRLLLPDHSDSDMALAAQHGAYSDLLEAGVKIYETQHETLHSKTVTVDGVWSVIGSSNFDHRSVLFNDEVDAVVLGADTAGQMETMFQDDLKSAKVVDIEAWDGRPLPEKLHEYFSRIWENLL